MKILPWPSAYFINQRSADAESGSVLSASTQAPTEIPPTSPPESPRESPAEAPVQTPIEAPQPDAPPLPVSEPPQASGRYIRFKRREQTWIIRRHTLSLVSQSTSVNFPFSNSDSLPHTTPHKS